ncbi:hypothetical protein [Nocardia sp. R6R-6]|uniref:hypothetical protein n=1 Tax=Nocardia sp. R6R-6 TaxID=3459303 RepID=UPI00403D7572
MTQTRVKLAAEAVADLVAERRSRRSAVVPYDAALIDHIQRMQTPSDSEEGRTMT